MSQFCDGCGKSVHRRRYMAIQKRWLGFDCGCLAADRVPVSTVNVFDITFDHVADEFGNKVHVSSLRELSAAEKRYGFQSCVMNQDAQNFNDPPQQAPVTIDRLYKRKFGARRA